MSFDRERPSGHVGRSAQGAARAARLVACLAVMGLVAACSHPLEIVGEGDIRSASGERDCLLEDFQAQSDNCTKNRVSGDYQETYYATPRPGWKFERWDNYCADATGSECSFDVPAAMVDKFWGETALPLRAIFVEEAAPTSCETSFDGDDVLIIDLSKDSETAGACGLISDSAQMAICVEEKIRARFADSPGCLGAFDVFVPGTNQEDGNYQQFTRIVDPTPGRTYLSVQYSYESTIPDDAIQYDKGVTDARISLTLLLYALKSRFDFPDIRVFGHSKGSDAVAQTSQQHPDVQFFAFAQPGRTPSHLRGPAGYIKKLYDNLVVLTWQNDEVKFYSGGSDGLQTPEIWGFPGYINETSGGLTVWPSRIDHHNNYGGSYTKRDYPYCATGNKAAMVVTNECKKQDGVRYLPYFWGDSECTSIAFDIMENRSPGYSHYIGYSGPRGGSCKERPGTVTASYVLKYSMTPADQGDCKYHMQLDFDGLDFGTSRTDGGSIHVSSTQDTYGAEKRGTIQIPLHMEIDYTAWMEDVSGRFSNCINYLDAQSEGYIHTLAVGFYHPGTGQYVSRTLIGNSEGIEYVWPQILTGRDNVGWRKTSGSWNMHFGIPPLYPFDAIMVKGDTGGGYSGRFYKWVHLVD